MACVFFCLERKWGRMAQVFRVERNKNFTVMKHYYNHLDGLDRVEKEIARLDNMAVNG